MEFSKYTEAAIAAAYKAGEILRNAYGTDFKISSKEGRNNLVTEFDKLSEKTIIEALTNEFPESSFLAEESGESGVKNKSGLFWVIDPLDGTVNFAHSIPIFSVSIAAMVDGELFCGIIYQPMLEEMFVAEKGKGAYLNGSKLSVSTNSDIQSAFLVTGFPYNVDSNPSDCLQAFIEVISQGVPVRRLGSAALDLAYTACGRFDGFWEVNLNPWDVAAGVLLVNEAGGKVTQYDGSEYSIYDKSILSTNGHIHEAMRSILKNRI
jgi:myo-inositol-1(or 4)-monophosphatase